MTAVPQATIVGAPEWHADPEQVTFTAEAGGRQYQCVMPRATFLRYRLEPGTWDEDEALESFAKYRSAIEHLVGELIRHGHVLPGDRISVH